MERQRCIFNDTMSTQGRNAMETGADEQNSPDGLRILARLIAARLRRESCYVSEGEIDLECSASLPTMAKTRPSEDSLEVKRSPEEGSNGLVSV